MVKNPPANTGDVGLIPGEGNGNPLQYSCRRNPMNGGVWRATQSEVTEELITKVNDLAVKQQLARNN